MPKMFFSKSFMTTVSAIILTGLALDAMNRSGNETLKNFSNMVTRGYGAGSLNG